MNEQDLFTLLEGTADAAFIASPSGRILYWNRAAEEMLGIAAKQAVGRLCWDVVQGRDHTGAAVCGPECAVLGGACGQPLPPAFDLEVPGGHWLNVSTIRGPAGRTECMTVHLVRDIDTRKRMENVTRSFLAQVAGLSGQTIEDLLQPAPVPHERLSPREREIMKRLVLGHGTAAMAAELEISKATVRNHVRAILSKLAVHTRTEAALLAIREKLI